MSEPKIINVSAGDAPKGWDQRDVDLWLRIMSLPAVDLVNMNGYHVHRDSVITQMKAAAMMRVDSTLEERVKALERRIAQAESSSRGDA